MPSLQNRLELHRTIDALSPWSKTTPMILKPREIMFHPARVNPMYYHYHCFSNSTCVRFLWVFQALIPWTNHHMAPLHQVFPQLLDNLLQFFWGQGSAASKRRFLRLFKTSLNRPLPTPYQSISVRPRVVASHWHSGTVAHGPQLVGRDCDDDLS